MNLATAYGREESHFVAGVKRRIPSGKLLIARGHDGRAILGQFGNAIRIESKEVLDRGSLVEVKRLLGLAGNIFQAAEEKDLDADGL